MKSYATLPLAAALFSSTALAWLPSCGWNDCMGSWSASSCDSSSGWSCFCTNQTAISEVNTCVATSCTNTTDQEAIYGAIAQVCANAGASVTASPEATFSATSGGSAWPSQITAGPGSWGPNGGWNSGDWSSWVSAISTAFPSAPSGWSSGGPWGNGGPGGWGNGNGGPGGWGAGGPWGTKASGVPCGSWTTWTAGWGPFSSWTGTWSGCSSTTASPSPATITTTVTSNGQASVITGTTFGIQAVAASSSSSSSSGSSSAPTIRIGLGPFIAVAGAVFITMIAL